MVLDSTMTESLRKSFGTESETSRERHFPRVFPNWKRVALQTTPASPLHVKLTAHACVCLA